MIIKKASPGLDQRNRLGELLGHGFTVEEFDGSCPLEDQVAQAEVLLVRDIPVTARVIDSAPRLRLIHRPGAHLRDVDVAYATVKGIKISRIPAEVQGAVVRDVAEHAFSLLLALAKKHRQAAKNVVRQVVGLPKTVRVTGKTLGLVGVGHTGGELAKIARAFGMNVAAVKRTRDDALKSQLGLSSIGTMESLHAMLGQCDFVSLHLPVTDNTRGLIGKKEIAAMRPGAILLNISRAPIIDKSALLHGLETGKLGGAGLDVYWEEPPDPDDTILKFANVIVTPHIAGDTFEVEELLARITADTILAVADGGLPKYLVPGRP